MTRLQTNKSTGPDSIPPRVIKELAAVLAQPLCALINTSIRHGIVPVQWKVSRISPIPKTIPPVNIESDLRPIAVTSTFAKIAEKCVNQFFNDHFLACKMTINLDLKSSQVSLYLKIWLTNATSI